MIPILPLLIALPFAAAVLQLVIDRRHAYSITLAVSAISLLLTIAAIAYSYLYGLQSLSFSMFYVPQLNLPLDLSVSMPTLALLLMTSIVFMAAALVGKYFIGERQRIYNILFLLAEGASLGVFAASNLFFLYVFWEISEIMMFFIIFMYGGYNRRYASIKFIIYSLISSLLLLIGIMLLYTSVTPHSFEISSIIGASKYIPQSVQLIIITLLTAAFLIKMPVFPLHSWLPDAHTEAPTTGSMILAGVLLKFGGYGLFLMFLMLPLASQYASYFFIIFLFSAIYSGFVCLGQTNIKRLIAYTSITDMAIVGAGLSAFNAFGTDGGIYFMLSHGIAISLLFLVAGTLDELYGTLEINKIKGVVHNFASLTYLFITGVFAAVGIPLTAGFVADLLVFIGAVATFGGFGILPLAGVVLIGAALFWLIERVFMSSSKPVEPYNVLSWEITASGVLLAVSAVALGILPFLILGIP